MRCAALSTLCVLVFSARTALASCASLLASTCASTPATTSCSICAGQHQHALKVAGCTALDVERYCGGGGGGGGGVHGSGRGFGDGKSALPEDPLLLSGASWWYGWGLSPSINSSFPQEFVAMAWGAKHKGVPLQRYLAEWTPHHSTKHLLGFNEPNLRHQSNLTATCAPPTLAHMHRLFFLCRCACTCACTCVCGCVYFHAQLAPCHLCAPAAAQPLRNAPATPCPCVVCLL